MSTRSLFSISDCKYSKTPTYKFCFTRNSVLVSEKFVSI
eukprot:14501.XXX_585594_585710_1 [CDS] Oithona nana genome sequencing.